MINHVLKLVKNIEESDKCTSQLVPMELVSILEEGKSDKDAIGRFLIELRNRNIRFDFEPEAVSGYRKAYGLIKQEDKTEAEKIYYGLIFVGKIHRITDTEVQSLLKRLKL